MILYLFLFISGASSQTYTCGETKLQALHNTPDLQLSGGRDTTPGLFPWTLALEIIDESEEFALQCGAVLIDPSWALTGARCVNDDQAIGQYRVVAGQLDRAEESGQEQYISISGITVHPEFNSSSPSFDNDLAILELSEPADIEGDQPVYPICLPPSSETRYWENPNCAITGYGLDNDTYTYPDYLQEAWMDVIRPANCELWWGEEGIIIDTHQCAYDQVNRDVSICEKDLGGPLSCMVNGRFDLAGVGSFYRDDCNARFPSIFTSIPQYLDWIVDITGVTPREPHINESM